MSSVFVSILDEIMYPETKNFAEYLKKLQACMDKIPEAFRNKAIVRIEEADDSAIHHMIAYYRPETDDDIKDRVERRRLREAEDVSLEKQTLIRLMAKYPDIAKGGVK